MSRPLRLMTDSFNEIASLLHEHFFCGVIGLAKFVGERFNEVDALPRQDNGCAFFERHCNKCSPAGMRAKAERRLFRMSHSEKPTPAARLPQFHARSPAPAFHSLRRQKFASAPRDFPDGLGFRFPASPR